MSRRLPLVLLALFAAVWAAGPAGAQQTGDAGQRTGDAGQAGPAIELRLVSVAPVVGPETPLGYRLLVRNPGSVELRDLRVQAWVGGPIRTRSELQRLADDPDAQPGNLGSLQSWQPRDGAATVAPGRSLALEPHSEPLPGWLHLPSPGAVLPLVLKVSAGSELGEATSRVTTFVTAVVGKAVDRPLRLALLVPLHEQSHRNPAGYFVDDRLAAQLAGKGPLGAIAAELARPGAPKISMVIDPLLIDEATAMGGGWKLRQGRRVSTVPAGDQRSRTATNFLRNLRQAASRNLPGILPYANADLPALVRAGYDAEALAPLLYAEQHLKEWLGPEPSTSLAWPVPGAIDAATLKVLDEAGAEAVVLDSHLLPTTTPTTPNATVHLGGGLGTLQHALVPDPSLSVALADSKARSAPVAWAQRILAETAITWLERPNSQAPRGILLAPPQSWRPTPGFFRSLVRGLGASPWLQLVRASDLATEVRQGPGAERRPLAPYTASEVGLGLPASYLHSVVDTRSQLTSFSRVVGSDFEALDDYDRDLLIAQSSDWRTAAGRARGKAFVRAVSQGIRAVYRHVGVQRTRVTLTSQHGAIPVTVTNSTDQRLTVVLRLSSPRVDLPPVSESFTLNPHEPVTRRIEVGTRTTGTFPIRVEVLTPDGKVRIVRNGQVTLVSTAFNRVALILAGGAMGFLLLWWGRKTGWRRRAPARGGGEAGADRLHHSGPAISGGEPSDDGP
ncbi:MAG TPA: DUF6049 family protein [Actinomycetes bacterium]|jgi:hypothetical protein|nr:DUF6049 family protein [Actinomycetes bacterium]